MMDQHTRELSHILFFTPTLQHFLRGRARGLEQTATKTSGGCLNHLSYSIAYQPWCEAVGRV
jgi:hypothetical protein